MARIAEVERYTKETSIEIQLNLDGSGQAQIDTGVGFFDHMLEGFARHGLFMTIIRSRIRASSWDRRLPGPSETNGAFSATGTGSSRWTKFLSCAR